MHVLFVHVLELESCGSIALGMGSIGHFTLFFQVAKKITDQAVFGFTD